MTESGVLSIKLILPVRYIDILLSVLGRGTISLLKLTKKTTLTLTAVSKTTGRVRS